MLAFFKPTVYAINRFNRFYILRRLTVNKAMSWMSVSAFLKNILVYIDAVSILFIKYEKSDMTKCVGSAEYFYLLLQVIK